MSTTRLGLPEISQSQAQKEVTHNQALWMLDCLVMASVKDRTNAPPGSPSEGDVYLVTATASGDWAGHEDDLAHYYSDAWHFYSPGEGWQVYVQDEDAWYVYGGSSWAAKDVTQPEGNDKNIQFNDGGSFGGSDDLTWDKSNKMLGVGTSSPNSTLHVNGSFAVKRTSVSANYTTSGEAIIGVTDTSSPRTVTLASSDCKEGRVIVVKDESGGAGTNNITINTEGSETIDGNNSVTISSNYGVVRLYSDGNDWFTF